MDSAPNLRAMIVPGLTAPGHDADTPSPSGRLPAGGMPAKSDLDYLKTMIELALLIIAVPWILHRLARNPRATVRKAGEGKLG